MQSELISKFSNVYIMLLYSIITSDMDRVKHYLSDELYNRYKNIVEENERNNEIQMYDELNVAKIDIIDKRIKDDKEIITVKLVSKYMDYKIDKNTRKYKSGINTRRIETDNILTFEKNINAKKRNKIVRCEGCGSGLDINLTGKCPYCGRIVEVEDFDYILTNIA